MRELDGCDMGNVHYSKYCPTLIFNDVFVPWNKVFMCGETEFAVDMVVKFSSFHRQSHGGCKSGKIDCMIGAALSMMDYNGTSKVGHHKQKVIDMIHRAETLYGCCLASSYEGSQQPSGTYFIDTVLANASKIHEGKELSEAIRLMVDISGGFVADMPSDRDFENSEVGDLLKKVHERRRGSAGGKSNQNVPIGGENGARERGYHLRHPRRRISRGPSRNDSARERPGIKKEGRQASCGNRCLIFSTVVS